jgi:phenylpropionate dioxygenase-like ring-hydroxylating dioxygenase large terminal subunit
MFNDMGNVVAFDNKCPHRGAKIYTEDSGNQIASCKYHRWAYRNSKIIVPDKHRFLTVT